MELPKHLPEKQEHKRILGEFYDYNKNKQWFYRAELVEMHPTHMKPTIVIYCNYNPVLEMKDILQFCNNYNIAHEILALSNQG